jgi:hypothetical protein
MGSFGGQNMNMNTNTGGSQFQTGNQPVNTTVIQKPAVVHEQVQEVQREIIQPVISRQREQTEIHQITQPFNQQEIRPTTVEERVLQPEYRPTFNQQSRQMPQPTLHSTREVAPTVRQVFQEQAIIEETVHRTVREEIQPIIYKETMVPTVIQQVKPIFEKIVEAPIIMKMERPPIFLKEGEQFTNLLGQQPRGMYMGQGGQGGYAGQPPLSSWDNTSKMQDWNTSNVKAPFGSTFPGTTTTTTTSTNAPLTTSTSNVNPAVSNKTL